MPTPPLEVPEILPWRTWWNKKATEVDQGQHVLFVGPTQSGKTLLCRIMCRRRRPVVVFGTKPVDPSLVAYVKEGYVRIDHWPPTNADYRRGRDVWEDGDVRFILWPDIKKRADLRRFAPVYAAAMDDIFITGHWTFVADEGLWIASPDGLGLGRQLGDMAYGTASNKVSMYLCVQRPSGIPPITWTSVTWAMVFKIGKTDDVRELASLGNYDPKDAIAAVKTLNPKDRENSHQFLDLPCRGGATWSISEVDVPATLVPEVPDLKKSMAVR
jgi:hypothetical protein